MHSRPDMGAAAEYRCASELLARGLIPSWPSTQTQPYDMIVDTFKGPKRVQVKSSVQKGTPVKVGFKMEESGRYRAYTQDDCDFIILYLFEHDVWYVFPIGITKRSLTLKPGAERCNWAPYLNAWHLITGGSNE